MATKGYTDYEPVNGAYPGVSGDFINEQHSRRGFGVQNVKAVANEATRTSTSKTLRYVGDRAQSYGRYLQDRSDELEELPVAGKTMAKARRQAGRFIERSGKASKLTSRSLLTGRGRTVSTATGRVQVTFAMGWTGLLNILSLPVGIMALAAFGGAALVADTTVGDIVTLVVYWMLGLEYFNVWVLGIGLYVLHAFLIITMFAGSYMQLKLGGLEPLGGQATVAKNLTFIGAFVVSAIPGTTFVPWIFAWLLIVWLYPN
ncbi:MAG: hypothetical protein ACK4SL_04155 [Candidatus Paceibacteria bacterium]